MVLPQSMRLKGYKCFDLIHRSGKRFYGDFMILRVVKARSYLLNSSCKKSLDKACRCGLTISGKVSKKAVVRNRLRRVFHEHLRVRLEDSSQHSDKWILLSLKPNSMTQQPSQLLKECDILLERAGFIHESYC